MKHNEHIDHANGLSSLLPVWAAAAGVALACAALACAPEATSPPPETPTAAAEPPPDAVEPEPEPAPAPETPPSDEATSAPPPATEEPKGPSIAEMCEAMCRRADEKCSKHSARVCRANCDKYVESAERCRAQVEAALICQTNATDNLLCSNVAPSSCATEFKAIEDCKAGKIARDEAKDASVPDDWARVSDTRAGFSVMMPPGAALDPKAPHRTWHAKSADGIDYYTVVMKPPATDPSPRMLLKMVIDYVGQTCQKDLKLHGNFEAMGYTTLRFDSRCPDGTEWHGMLRTSSKNTIVTSFHAKSGQSGVLDPFFFSFKPTGG